MSAKTPTTKTAAKKAAKPAAKEAAPKKPVAKKAAPKKAAPKKPAAKKAAPKKPAAKKATPKKPVAKKAAPKEPAAKPAPKADPKKEETEVVKPTVTAKDKAAKSEAKAKSKVTKPKDKSKDKSKVSKDKSKVSKDKSKVSKDKSKPKGKDKGKAKAKKTKEKKVELPKEPKKKPAIKVTDVNSIVMVQYAAETSSVTATLTDATEELNKVKKSEGVVARAKTFETTGTPIGEIKSIIARTSKEIRKHCLPCPQLAGMSYVKAKDVPTVQSIFDDAVAEIDKAKRKVSKHWDELRAAAERRMGDLAHEVDLPNKAEFIEGFKIQLQWSSAPAPVSGTVLESLSDEVSARIKAESEKGINSRLVDASAQSVRDVIAMMADAIETIPKCKRLRQERLDRIADRIADIGESNWANNDDLNALFQNLTVSLDLDDATKKDVEGRMALVKSLKEAKQTATSTLEGLGL